MIPDEMQVDSALQSEVVAESNRGKDQFDSALSSRMLARGLQEMDVKQLDLLEPFKQAAVSKRLYKPRDTHWNIAGNKLAADLIGNYISKTILTNCRRPRHALVCLHSDLTDRCERFIHCRAPIIATLLPAWSNIWSPINNCSKETIVTSETICARPVGRNR